MPSVLGTLRRGWLAPAFGVALTDAFVLAYAAFTLACQLTVLAGGLPSMLWRLGSVAMALVAAIAIWALSAGRASLLAHLEDGARLESSSRVPGQPSSRVLLAGLLLAIVGFAITRSAYVVWACALAVSGFAVVQGLRAPAATPAPDATPSPDPPHAQWLVHGGAVLAAAIALFTVRPRSDDAFYTSMAHSLLRAPDLPLLSASLVHGPPSALLGPQPMFAPYRVHSFELLGGFLGGVLGVDPTAVLHLGLGALIAFLTPYALARLLRQLAPGLWPVAFVAAMLFYCVEGTASVGYANQAFVRSYHGKSALLTLGVPLILTYALRFGLRPTRARFAWLALAQIAALGMSSTALWLAPLLGVLGAAAAAPSARQLLRRGALAALATAWVLALGIWVFGQMRVSKGIRADELPDVEQSAAAASGAGSATTGTSAVAGTASTTALPSPLEDAVALALGPERTATVLLAIVPLALLALPLGVTFRLFGLLGLALTLLLTPPLASYVGRFVTGVATYHRLFWLLPVPLASGLAAAGVWQRARAAQPPMMAALIALAALGAGYGLGVQRLLLSEANRVRFVVPPALEVGVRAREVAVAACELAPPGTYILASPSVSEQVAILPGCGHPVIAAARWMLAPRGDRARREQLARYLTVDGDVPLADAPWFLESLDHYAPRVVVVLQEALRNRRVKLLLRLAGYEKVAVAAENHVFTLRSPWQAKQDRKTASELCLRAGKGARLFAPFGIATGLERGGQCGSLLAVRAARSSFDAETDALAQLERLIATPSVFEPGETDALRAVLLRNAIRGVVVASAAYGNGPLKQVLSELHYRQAGAVSGHRLYLSPTAAAGPAAPAP
jgi:hypothetical protein